MDPFAMCTKIDRTISSIGSPMWGPPTESGCEERLANNLYDIRRAQITVFIIKWNAIEEKLNLFRFNSIAQKWTYVIQ